MAIQKFKVGDKVKIRSDLRIGKYGNILAASSMVDHAGKEVTIRAVVDAETGKYQIRESLTGCETHWLWHADMFEPVSNKFKVGDMVIGNDPDRYSITKLGWIGKVTRVCDNDSICVYGAGVSGKTRSEFNVNPKYFDLYKPNSEKIVITHDGKTTTATMYCDDGSKKTATAKCAPEDTFDFKFGANLAMERLIGKAETKVEPVVEWRVVNRKPRVGDYIRLRTSGGFHFSEPGDILKVDSLGSNALVRVYGRNHPRDTGDPNHDWPYIAEEYEVVEKVTATEPKKPEPPKYYNGKVVCIKNRCDDREFTVGKIYEIVDGQFTDNLGRTRPTTNDRVTTINDLTEKRGYFRSWYYDFIPLVEDENKPLTIEELEKMDGKRVWCSSMSRGVENFTDRFCGWHTVSVEERRVYDENDAGYSFDKLGHYYGFRAYRKPPTK